MPPKYTIEEKDVGGNIKKIYLVSSSVASSTSSSLDKKDTTSKTLRVDVISGAAKSGNGLSTTTTTTTTTTAKETTTDFIGRLLTPFLPTGYPHTVTPDYTPYQLYDSLQAFASTIASLLASRAVLVGLGVGSESASATSAMLLSIAQESIGRFATIFFGHYFALRIEAEVKLYRFLADIVNDVAFVLDLLSPSLPSYGRVPALCVSSACRAVCGVAGGSSKAILSSHFAKAGNIGELNAKDGSQETVVNLLGMWVGGLVVSKVHGTVETWLWLLALLGVHLWANWCAVKSVRLRNLNQSRAGVVLGAYMGGRGIPGIEEVGASEKVFMRGDLLRGIQKDIRASCHIGSTMESLLLAMKGQKNRSSGAISNLPGSLEEVLEVFAQEDYLLWFDESSHQIHIILKSDATSFTQLRSWCHALRIVRMWERSREQTPVTKDGSQTLIRTFEDNNREWEDMCKKLAAAGWELSNSSLESGARHRISIEVRAS